MVEMRRIKLTRGYFALVDDDDHELLGQIEWIAHGQEPSIYARSNLGNDEYILMHRLIMNAPDGLEVDHIDGNGLNNQRSNMRLCDHQQNTSNRRMNLNSKSGYKGVNRLSQIKPDGNNPWRATIRVNGLKKHIGCFSTPEEAALAYDEAALEHYGEFARTNKSMNLLP